MIKGKLLQSRYEQLLEVQLMEKLASDLSLGLKFVKLEILSTSFTAFLYGKFSFLVIL